MTATSKHCAWTEATESGVLVQAAVAAEEEYKNILINMLGIFEECIQLLSELLLEPLVVLH